MSLVVWLPLTKDLRQQGLSNVEAINSGATYSSTGGKLGGCYSFDGTDDFINLGNVSSYFKGGNIPFSICFWIYSSENGSRGVIFSSYGLPNSTNFFCIEINSGSVTNNSLRFDWKASPDWATDVIVTLNTWIHVVITYDGSQIKFYKNGELIQTKTQTLSTLTTSNNWYLGRDTRTGTTALNGKINDFRIYDHCLSPMEVKQISQGLVLHYPLNREGWGQENLMPNSTIMSVGSANASTGSWRVAGSSQMTRSRVAISDSPIGDVYGCQSVGLQTGQDASCWGIDGFPRENGTTYTISAWGRIVGGSSTAAMLGFSIYSGTTLDYGGTYGQAKSSDTKYYGSGAYDYAGGQLNPNGNWTRIYRTFTSTSTSDNIYVGFNTAKTGNNVTLQLCGVKLEKGEKVTSWCPKSTDDLADVIGLNENIEYDCSGFCNNGEYYAYDTNGSISYTSDTPKYSVSTHIASANPTQSAASGTRYLYGHCELTNPTQMSVAFWLKPITGGYGGTTSNGQGYFCTTNYEYGTTSVGSDYQASAMNHRDGAVNMNDSASTTQCNVTFYPTIGEWHHYVYTYDGQVGRGYKDGVQTTTAQFSAAKTLDSFIGVVIGFSKAGGVWRRNDACYSDFRIYATALSADDIRAIYENSAYIDNSGNTYAATYMEV